MFIQAFYEAIIIFRDDTAPPHLLALVYEFCRYFEGPACPPVRRGPGRAVGHRRQLGSTVADQACTFVGRTSTVLRTTPDIIDDDYGFFPRISKTSPIR